MRRKESSVNGVVLIWICVSFHVDANICPDSCIIKECICLIFIKKLANASDRRSYPSHIRAGREATNHWYVVVFVSLKFRLKMIKIWSTINPYLELW